MQSRSILLKNMFDPEEQVNSSVYIARVLTGSIQRNGTRLGQGPRGGCQGRVSRKVWPRFSHKGRERNTGTYVASFKTALLISPQGEIYVKFDSVESAKKAVQGLNGRWFGGKQVSATFISDAIMQAHQ